MKLDSIMAVASLALTAACLSGCPASSREAAEPELGSAAATALPTGQRVTPVLAPGATFGPLDPGLARHPDLEVGGAVTEVVAPDHATLAVLTTGFNKWDDPKTGKHAPDLQGEYVFLYDVSGGRAVRQQVLQVPNTWAGIAFSPDARALYVAGGVDDDVHTFARGEHGWAEQGTPIPLGHAAGNGPKVKPVAAGLAVTADGRLGVVANMYNDSISLVDLTARGVAAEIDLRPGKSGGARGEPGGNYPYWVAIRGNDTAYVSSVRDREVVVVDLPSRRITSRIKLRGNPNKMILDRRGNGRQPQAFEERFRDRHGARNPTEATGRSSASSADGWSRAPRAAPVLPSRPGSPTTLRCRRAAGCASALRRAPGSASCRGDRSPWRRAAARRHRARRNRCVRP